MEIAYARCEPAMREEHIFSQSVCDTYSVDKAAKQRVSGTSLATRNLDVSRIYRESWTEPIILSSVKRKFFATSEFIVRSKADGPYNDKNLENARLHVCWNVLRWV